MDEDLNSSVNLKQFIGVGKVADMLDISEREVYRLIAGGELPKPVKIGRLSKLLVTDVLSYVEKLNSARVGPALKAR